MKEKLRGRKSRIKACLVEHDQVLPLKIALFDSSRIAAFPGG